SLAARLAVPLKGPVGEVDRHAQAEEVWPENAALLALGDRVGGHECNLDRLVPGAVLDRLLEPAGHIVEAVDLALAPPNSCHVGLLVSGPVLVASEGRIAEKKGALCRRQNAGPVHLE